MALKIALGALEVHQKTSKYASSDSYYGHCAELYQKLGEYKNAVKYYEKADPYVTIADLI